jgi:hypothetical protein
MKQRLRRSSFQTGISGKLVKSDLIADRGQVRCHEQGDKAGLPVPTSQIRYESGKDILPVKDKQTVFGSRTMVMVNKGTGCNLARS